MVYETSSSKVKIRTESYDVASREKIKTIRKKDKIGGGFFF